MSVKLPPQIKRSLVTVSSKKEKTKTSASGYRCATKMEDGRLSLLMACYPGMHIYGHATGRTRHYRRNLKSSPKNVLTHVGVTMVQLEIAPLSKIVGL